MLAKRDLAVMLLSLFAVYHSLLRDGVVSFDRAWYVPAEESSDDLAASSARGDRAGGASRRPRVSAAEGSPRRDPRARRRRCSST
jgi:hypothetical protein